MSAAQSNRKIAAAVLLVLAVVSAVSAVKTGEAMREHLQVGVGLSSPAACGITPFSDGETYFADLVDVVTNQADKIAKIGIVGWQIDPYVELTDGVTLSKLLEDFADTKDNGDHGAKDVVRVIYWQPGRGRGLNRITKEAQGETSINRLKIIKAFLHKPERGIHVMPVTYGNTLATGGTISNHQKFVVLEMTDGTFIEYVGGLDLAFIRRDASSHPVRSCCQGVLTDELPSTWETDGFTDQWLSKKVGCTPWHDVQVRVEGAATSQLVDVFHERWHFALNSGTNRDLVHGSSMGGGVLALESHGGSGVAFAGSKDLPTGFFNTAKAGTSSRNSAGQCNVVQTSPTLQETIGPMIEWIKNAKRYVYIENQYFVSPPYYTRGNKLPVSPDFWRSVVANNLARIILDKVRAVIKNGCVEEFTAVVVMPLQTFSPEVSRISRKSLSYGTYSLYGRAKYELEQYVKKKRESKCALKTADDFVVPVFLASTGPVLEDAQCSPEDEVRDGPEVDEESDDFPIDLESDDEPPFGDDDTDSDEVTEESDPSPVGDVDIKFTPLVALQTGEGQTFSYQTVFTHTKLLIVDDKHAYVGSANINDRSLLKSRLKVYKGDAEVGVIFGCGRGEANCQSNADVVALKNKLWKEHLGTENPAIGDWSTTANSNLAIIKKWQEQNPDAFIDPETIDDQDVMCTRDVQTVNISNCGDDTPCELQGHAVRIPEVTFYVKGATGKCKKKDGKDNRKNSTISRIKQAGLLGEWI